MRKPIFPAVLLFFICCGCDEPVDPTSNPTPNQATSNVCKKSEDVCLSLYEVSSCDEDGVRRSHLCKEDEMCFDAKCAPVSCEPNAIDKCEANGQFYGCNPLGTGKGVFDCLNNQTCLDGKCVARVCSAGDGRCLDNDTLLLCNEAGTELSVKFNCRENDPRTTCESGRCVSLCDINSKSASYIGCEYWAVDLDNAIDAGVYDAAGQPYAVVLSNTREDVSANVEIYTYESAYAAIPAPILSFEIPARELRKIYLPNACYDNGHHCAAAYAVNGTTITPSAYYIKSDLPITAAQFNPLDNMDVFSNDASLLLPVSALGRRYMVMTRKQHYDTLRAFMTVVAVEAGQTQVTVKSACKTVEGVDVNGNKIYPMKKGDTQIFVLNQYDVLNIETDGKGEDLTGSEITADQLISVFAGSEATSVPETDPVTCCADHLEQQLYPIQAWGRKYNAVRTRPRRLEREAWRILSRVDGTVVKTVPNLFQEESVTLNAGKWIDLLTTESFEIEATSPVLVGQFMTGEHDPHEPDTPKPSAGAAGIGDPTYILGVPVEQYRKEYSFLVPSKYAKNYITVVAPAGTNVILDGSALPLGDFFEFGSGEYTGLYREMTEGRHYLSADQPVGLFVYGIDDAVSYGYPAGLDLANLFD